MEAIKKTTSITVQDVPVTIMNVDQRDYISLTDMAKARTDAGRAADVIKNWLRARSTLEFLGTWEVMYNPNFKVVEFDHFKSEAGLHTFTLSAKEWIEKTNAVGIYVQAGRYGGTYAHKDIAFEFGSAISPVFKLYLLKYADEADLLNVALFGCTAKAWREANPTLAKNSNIRDYASIAELTVLSNLETHNAELIKSRMEKKERFEALRQIAQYQLRVLAEAEKIKELPTLEDKS